MLLYLLQNISDNLFLLTFLFFSDCPFFITVTILSLFYLFFNGFRTGLLYPIYYSDQKYDATEYIKTVIKQQLVQSFPPPFQAEAINSLPNMKWERERIGLIKKKCHEYDKEWRIILPNLYDMSQTTEKPSITWIPSSITIGLRTKQYEKSLIISLAKEAGISKVYQCYINDNDELDKKIIYSE